MRSALKRTRLYKTPLRAGSSVAHVTVTDEQLVARFQASQTGDTGAFDTLIQRHQHYVRVRCLRLTGAAADVDDLAQDVFLKAYVGLDKFTGRSTFRTWLHVITTRHCIDFLRQRRDRVFVDLDEASNSGARELSLDPAAIDILLSKANRRFVWSVVSQLPDGLRRPLLLRECDGLDYQSIADECGVSLAAVKMRLMRARRQARRRAVLMAGQSRRVPPCSRTLSN